MNEIINKFLLEGDKFMPFKNNQYLLIVPVAHLQKIKKELENV